MLHMGQGWPNSSSRIKGLKPISIVTWFCGVVVITSALHAEGREFEPRQNLVSFLVLNFLTVHNCIKEA